MSIIITAKQSHTAAKLPYGISNFERLITERYAYVDKTRFIEQLEHEFNPYQLFIRPRTFGKSLFFTTLSCYYDLNYADKFETLFKGLYIGKHPTPKHNNFTMLKFDFSGLDTSSVERFTASFYDSIQKALLDFVKAYQHLFSDSADIAEQIKQTPQSISALRTIFSAASFVNAKLFILIDEYDHFVYDLIALGTAGNNIYRNMIKANGIVRVFYETLKIGTKSVVNHIFITGISPMMMNDLASSFNIISNLSLNLQYNEMLGFSHDEINTFINASSIDRALITMDMEHYYNGYLFNKHASTRVYNPTMTLYCLNQIHSTQLPPEDIINVNLRTNYSILHQLAENEHNRTVLLNIMKNDTITDEVAASFSIDEMYSEQYFASLLFYMGLLTIDRVDQGITILKPPNYSIRTIYWEYIELFTRNLNKNVIIDSRKESAAIRALAYNGDIDSYINYMSKNIFQRLSDHDLIGFDEKYIKLMFLGSLFRSRLYVPSSKKEVEHGYIDIFLQRSPLFPDIPYEWVWELKYLKKADATEKQIVAVQEAMRAQLARYRASSLFAGRDDVKFAAILFIGKEAYNIMHSA
ncbi:MAG: ATP-binding protein [Treponema sp.]|jgi:hypothetical protein|nr:ATP-binding protein [Treponema sp.]